jgi:hypothetical protein
VARLPIDAGDTNVWGQLLNEYLLVAHNADGTVKAVSPGIGQALTSGEVPYDRRHVDVSPAFTSGDMVLTYFVACKTETITKIAMYSGGTAAATVTMVRFGVYSVATNGDLTLTNSTANDVSIFTTINTRYERTLTTSWSKVAGARYAVGMIVLATTMPTFLGSTAAGSVLDAVYAREPRLSGSRGGQSDLPASVTAVNVGASRRSPYFEAIP